MEFVASLVASLAGPVAVVVLVVVFRPVLAQLAAGGVRRWKAGPAGVEVEYWDRETSEVKASIGQQVPAGEAPLPGGSLSEELAEVVTVAPSAAVLEAFSRIEAELRRIITGAGVVPEEQLSRMSARQLSLLGLEHDLITPESANAIEGLAVMRNLAAHGQANTQLDQTRALEFVHLADAVLFALRSKA
jgi:hypothetical protein